jgi:hypothetical protein
MEQGVTVRLAGAGESEHSERSITGGSGDSYAAARVKHPRLGATLRPCPIMTGLRSSGISGWTKETMAAMVWRRPGRAATAGAQSLDDHLYYSRN